MDGLPSSRSPRILIVRLSAIGDTIHTLPVLNALRDRFPQSFLAWLVEERAGVLLRGHAALDDLITVPRGWLKSPRTVWQLARRLRRLRFDVSLDVQGLTKSGIASWLSGARRRIGFGDDKGRELSRWFTTEKVRTTSRHVIDCNLELLRPLGIERPQVRFDLPCHEEDQAAAEAMLAELDFRERFAIVNPGAGAPSKLWPPDRFAAVAAHLGQAHGVRSLVVWAGEEERAWAGAIAAGSAGHARVAPSTSLGQLAALARRAALFVGSDTGPLHIAAAVGTPCVGLFGPWPAERNGPYGPQHIALEVRRFEGSTGQRRHAPPEIMQAITVSMVSEACDRMLGP